MSPFQYASATTPDEAISLIGKNGRYLGGGIDLLGEMKEYIVEPDVLVDVKEIQKLHFVKQIITMGHGDDRTFVEVVTVEDDSSKAISAGTTSWAIGATTTIAEIANHPHLQTQFPGLVEAASEVGSPQIRNVATLGGNLLQHSRCWYYRQPDIQCLKRGGKICYGTEGENKYLSLFSGSACISPIVSNLSVILTALDASVDISKSGFKKLHDLYTPAWEKPEAHNSLKQGELLNAVVIPLKRTKSAYRQVSEKKEFDWALVSCAAAGNVTNGKITDARVVLGAVAPIPYMVASANDYLEGKDLTDEHASHAADLILKNANPLAHNGYKIPLAHTLIRRTLLALNA